MHLQRAPSALIVGLVLIGLAGCGEENSLGRLPIQGTVTFEGEPLDQGTIQFRPQGEDAKVGSGATIKNGKYSIPAEKGLPEGTYLVRIFSADSSGEKVEVPGATRKLPKEKIPPEYNVKSDKTIEVTSEKTNKFDFQI